MGSIQVPSGWKIYRNEEYGFEINIPSSWTVDSVRSDRDSSGSDIVFDTTYTESYEGISRDYVGDGLLSDWLNNKGYKSSLLDIKIDGETAYYTDIQGVGAPRFIWVKHGEYIYAIESTGGLRDNAVLSTFRFIEITKPITSARSFSSNYFTLSFMVPPGFEVIDSQNTISVAQKPYETYAIGSSNAFLHLQRYDKYYTRDRQIALYRQTLKELKESTAVIGGSSFLKMTGIDSGMFEGDSAGRMVVVFFDASWLEIMERPGNKDQNFDPILTGYQILSTFKFTK